MPQMKDKGFFQTQLEKFFNRDNAVHSPLWNTFDSICASVGVASRPFRDWTKEQIEYVIEGAKLKWDTSRLKKMLNPAHKLEQTKLLFKCFKDNIALSVTNKYKTFEENLKAVDLAKKTREEFEKKLGVENLFNSQMNKLTPEQQAIYSEVPENVKKHFIEICMQSTRVGLGDLDPNMTAAQAEVIAKTAHLYFEAFPKRECLTGNIFKDEKGNLLSAEKMLNAVCKDYSAKMLENDYTLSKSEIKNYETLQRLSYQITGKANDDLMKSRKGFQYTTLDTLDIDIKFDYLESLEGELNKKDQILQALAKSDKYLDQMSYTDIESFADDIMRGSYNLDNKTYIIDVIRCAALGQTELTDEEIEQFGLTNPRGLNYDANMIEAKTRAYLNAVKENIETELENEDYMLNGQHIVFKDGTVTIENESSKMTMSLKDLELDKNSLAEKMIEFKQFAATGMNNEMISNLAKKTQEEQTKKAEAEKNLEKIENNIKKLRSKDISQQIGADKNLNILQSRVQELLKNKDIKVILTRTGNIQICTPQGDQKNVLNFSEQNYQNVSDKGLLDKLNIEPEKQSEILNKISDQIKQFANVWDSKKVEQELQIYDTKQGNEAVKNLVEKMETFLDINNLGKDNLSEKIKQLKEKIPNMTGLYVADNKYYIETQEKLETPNGQMVAKGLISLDRTGKYETIGNNSSTKDFKDTINGKQLRDNVIKTIEDLDKELKELSKSVNKDNNDIGIE